MWRRLPKEIKVRIEWAVTIAVDAGMVILWAYIMNYLYKVLPAQLPYIDKVALDFFLLISTLSTLSAAAAYFTRDVAILWLRTLRAIDKERKSRR
jgi:hypothetical protein